MDTVAKKQKLSFDQLPDAVSEIKDQVAEIWQHLKSERPAAPVTADKDYLTVQQVAALLHYSPVYVRRLAGDGKLSCKRIGKRLLFTRGELDRFIISEDHKKQREARLRKSPKKA